ncbi:hypothetical protein BTO05_03530 [Winogradskyella sp. PC-19]|uniref:hypothetical protein n=1 Tax=unclassified Winogradskyella TaxID=2615021 RepID=UPI000B55A409|nr:MULTISPECIES: hypothetical protein [unclassified Winogradskyella]ARV10706.1 hypothetical protein BTO05_03530 [Winogradskyella sp. PC-19]
MRNIFVVLVALFLMSSCDDGDVITIDLDFDQELSLCSNNTDSFIIYDLRNDPSESLSLVIPRSTSEVVPFFNPTPLDNPESITIDNASNRFLYRTYNRDLLDSGSNQELCSAVIPSDLIIQESYEATGGTAEITTTIVDDDNDGIPSEFEGRGEADANGNFPDAEDFDGDGVPNYLDQDDDDDNVPTLFEIDTENADGDDNPTTNFLDTDGDTIPDYLDEDDDGDDIPTINEDANGDKNPRNDTSINSNGILIADYLSDEVSINHESPGKVLINEYTRVTTSRIFIKDYNLEILSGDLIDFGTLINTITVQQEFEED